MSTDEYKKDDEMDSFLSDTMQIINKLKIGICTDSSIHYSCDREILNNNIVEIEHKFITAMRRARELFDNCAFRITTPSKFREKKSPRAPINKSLFEAWSVLLANMTEDNFQILRQNKELLYQKIDAEFDGNKSLLRNFISKDSTKISGVRGRYAILKKIITGIVEEVRQ
jgi:hypothetical protein